MKLSRRQILIGAALVLGATAAAARVLRPARVPVEVARAEYGPLRVTLDDDGLTRVQHHTTVAAPITGRMLESTLRAGDSVRRGDVVAMMIAAPLDPRDRAREAERARSASALVAAAREQADAARLALDEARRARVRADQLFASGAIAARDHEEAVTLERTRRHEADAARDRVRAAESDAAAARAALADAGPYAAGATGTGSVTRVPIRAPLSGRVLRVYEEHDRAVAAGTPLVELGDPADLEIVVDVLTADAGAVRPGALMLVRANDTAAALRARVTRVEPAGFRTLSPLGVEEQRVNVIGKPVEPTGTFGDAYRVEVSIVLWESPHVLRVPVAALVADVAGWGVFQVRGGRAYRRTIAVGHRGTRDAEVTGGLAEGDLIVVYPGDRVRDGVRVCVGSSCR